MIQLKKTILTLVALLAVTTGAWAQTETLLTTITPTGKGSYSETKSGVVSVTATNVTSYDDTYGWLFFDVGSLSVTAEEGYTINKCVFRQNNKQPITDTEAPFEIHFSDGCCTEDTNWDMDGVTSIEVYGYVTPAAPSGPKVAWDKDKNTGTFKMPGGNVTLEPEYYPQAALTAAPTAINDVPATTDGAIVKAGTVANIGSTETAQGTVMYYVSPTALDDAALLALAADKWTADVPTAAHLAQGKAYVYYYVRGNDSDTDEENFSDGDILAANALQVTLGAAPTYAVTFAEGTPETDKWTASPNAGVKKGTPVTVTYTGSKKVIGVKAEKKKAAEKTIKIDGQDYTVLDGETWKQFITRNKLSGWYVDLMKLSTWGVFIDEPYSKLHVSSDGTNWTQLVFSSQDAPIDTDKQYKWVQEDIGGGGAPF